MYHPPIEGKTVKPQFFLLLTIPLLCSCKGGGGGGILKSAITLKDAPPATAPEGWAATPPDVGFTLALPQGWRVAQLDEKVLKTFVDERNSNAWDIMEEQKADVDLTKARALGGVREYMSPGFMFTDNKHSTQELIAIREDTGGNLGLDDAVARWRDTLFGGSSPPPVKEDEVELPVGKAKTLSAASTTLGIIDKTTVYFLVDGTVQYTLFFFESAQGGADPIPTREIMETFRPAK